MTDRSPLDIVRIQWRNRLLLKAAAWVVLVAFLVLCIHYLFGFSWLSTAGGIVLSSLLAYKEWRKSPTKTDLIQLVNDQFASTEYSTDLLFAEPSNGLESLQQNRVAQRLEQELPKFVFPIQWKEITWGLGALALTVGFLAVLPQGENSNQPSLITPTFKAELQNEESDSVNLETVSITMIPPKYTQLKSRTYQDFNLEIPEGSRLINRLSFSGRPAAVWISTNEGDSLAFAKKSNEWQLNWKPAKNQLYTLSYLDQEKRKITSEYHQIQILPDQPPTIEISGTPQFERLEFRPNIEVDLGIQMTDNYGLTDGYLIATITKGAGESVKFREQKIPLKATASGKAVETKLTLDFDAFGMEPGNELYFYGVAFDNHEPENQQTRTATYFLVLEDTTEVEFSLQGELGIDIMPDYFRSQLQIIIDSEKLLKERGTLAKEKFNKRSNSLASDQKMLRLKYGQFIGEEEDSGIEAQTEEPEGPDSSGENVLQEFGHDHDHENEEGELMDKGTEPAENPLKEFMHEHEDEETATFQTQQLKAKLRAALSEMWDAELHLRLYDPKQSLPFQYSAQKLLKEIKNHARIYVQRIGFEPPPVNVAESRLKGKLKQLNEQAFVDDVEQETIYPAIRKAIVLLDRARLELATRKQWRETERQTLQTAGDELAGLAVDYPGKYLTTLNGIRGLLSSNQLQPKQFAEMALISRSLESALPKEDPKPLTINRSQDELTKQFIDHLLNPKNR